jgi:hypothetical protein
VANKPTAQAPAPKPKATVDIARAIFILFPGTCRPKAYRNGAASATVVEPCLGGRHLDWSDAGGH